MDGRGGGGGGGGVSNNGYQLIRAALSGAFIMAPKPPAWQGGNYILPWKDFRPDSHESGKGTGPLVGRLSENCLPVKERGRHS